MQLQQLRGQHQSSQSQQHSQSISQSTAFDASHPSHPYHDADRELGGNQPGPLQHNVGQVQGMDGNMIMVEAQRAQGN